MATFVSNHNIDVSFVKCPYDNNHLVPKHRLTKHLAKCQLTHEPLMMCPFNGSHRVKRNQFEHHLLICSDRTAILRQQMKIAEKQRNYGLCDHQSIINDSINPSKPETEDNWD